MHQHPGGPKPPKSRKDARLNIKVKGENPKPITIDMTPTWGEIGRLYVTLVESDEKKALKPLKKEIARMASLAECMKVLMGGLTKKQREEIDRVYDVEMAKQGYDS